MREKLCKWNLEAQHSRSLYHFKCTKPEAVRYSPIRKYYIVISAFTVTALRINLD